MIKDYGIDGVYIVHAKKGYEIHEQRINTLLKSYNMQFEFVTDGDPSLFDSIDLDKYFTSDIRSSVPKGALSCTLNHIISYEKIVANKNRYAVVFENDPFFIGNFVQKIEKVAKEADSLPPGFIISLENTTLQFPSFWETKKNRYLYQASRGRCAGAYLIDFAAAKASLDSLTTEKCNDIIDWWHNRLIERGIVRMYWAHPALVEQGSHNGQMCSTISSKQKNLIRRFLWNIQKIYKVFFRRLWTQKRLIKKSS